MVDKKYREQLAIHEKMVLAYRKKSNLIGNIKLLVCLILLAILIFRFSDGMQMIVLAMPMFALFVFLWIYHGKVIAKWEKSKRLVQINQKYLARIDGSWVDFDDTAKEFLNVEHLYASDLDIIGEKSLFQLLNSSNTHYGRKAFVTDLLESDYDEQTILKRQKAIAELSQDILFSNEFQSVSANIRHNNGIDILLDNLKTNTVFVKQPILRLIFKYLPMLTAPFAAFTVIFQMESLYVVAIHMVLAQFLLWVLGVAKLMSYFSSVGAAQYSLNSYSNLFALMQAKQFESELLQDIQARLTRSEESAATAIKQLEKIMQRINLRYNILLYFIFNAFLLWDYECAFSLEKWKKKYASEAERWFQSIGEFESLLSFANLANINEHTCFPQVRSTENNQYGANELGHPLLSNEGRVYNDFEMNGKILIISGSNMSGKTTFLRTVGINLVLAQAGCAVCAKSMAHSLFKIATSMRIADDLSGGISTFYAELKKIKAIMDCCQAHQNTLFLIDEIFRGTNSTDRLEGAKAVLMNLQALSVSGLITTHDLELCKLAEQENFCNFSFSEYYENHEIKFDYKMKVGQSTTTNARYLMEMIGIRRKS